MQAEVGDELVSAGKTANNRKLKVLSRAANTDPIILHKSLKEMNTRFSLLPGRSAGEAVPGVGSLLRQSACRESLLETPAKDHPGASVSLANRRDSEAGSCVGSGGS
jgi:hypothetical protein